MASGVTVPRGFVDYVAEVGAWRWRGHNLILRMDVSGMRSCYRATDRECEDVTTDPSPATLRQIADWLEDATGEFAPPPKPEWTIDEHGTVELRLDANQYPVCLAWDEWGRKRTVVWAIGCPAEQLAIAQKWQADGVWPKEWPPKERR